MSLNLPEFCKKFSLFQENEITFTYMRFFKNSTYCFLSNDNYWSYFYNKKLNNISKLFEKCLRYSYQESLYCQKIWLWDDSLSEFPVSHSLSYFMREENYVETWIFSYKKKINNIDDYFLNNQLKFRKFIANFQVSNFYKELDNYSIKYNMIRKICLAALKNPHIMTTLSLPSLSFPLLNKQGSLEKLTERQFQIINMAAQGQTSDMTAQELGIAKCVVIEHRQRVKKKLGVFFWNEVMQLYWKTREMWF